MSRDETLDMASAMGNGTKPEEEEPTMKTILSVNDVTEILHPEDVANVSGLDPETAEDLLNLVRTRASNRKSGRVDAIVFVEEWATQPKYDITNSRILLVGRIKNYSEKAYECEGAFEVNMDELRRNPDQAINDLVDMIDERDDGAYKKGAKFLPKSAVTTVGSVKQ